MDRVEEAQEGLVRGSKVEWAGPAAAWRLQVQVWEEAVAVRLELRRLVRTV